LLTGVLFGHTVEREGEEERFVLKNTREVYAWVKSKEVVLQVKT
jgi:hypothetical protein